MKIFLKAIFFILAVVFVLNTCWAAEKEAAIEEIKYFTNVEFLTGFGVAKLREQKTYHVSPVFVDFDFDLAFLTEKIGISPPGLLQFVLEPFAAYVSQPYDNAEVGTNFLIKIGILPETSRFQPYFKGGIGLLYMSQHTREQSTQFNFSEYVGLGMHYFFNKTVAFTIEYRYRHLSNASIRDPNKGIDTNYGICGVSCLF